MQRAALPLLLAAFALMACLGGGKESPEGQADYLDRWLEITSDFNRVEADLACRGFLTTVECDRVGLESALRAYVDAWEDLDAPQELRAAEEANLSVGRQLIEFLAVPAEEADERIDEFPELVRASELQDEWDRALLEEYGVRTFMFEGASMNPSFCDGDTVAIKPPEGPIRRWDVIVFEFPQDRERDFVKRVVGLPGETIEVRDETIYIGGAPVEGDIYALAEPNYIVEPLTIPANRYYVLGDNRRNSFDSHVWYVSAADGPEAEVATVPYDHIIGVLPSDLMTCSQAP